MLSSPAGFHVTALSAKLCRQSSVLIIRPLLHPMTLLPLRSLSDVQQNVKVCVEHALAGASLKPSDLAAVGITNQRESTLVWDRHTGKPLHRLIVWNDSRTESICRWR